MAKLANKVAVITGGSGAIGSTTAKLFLNEGAKVVLVDINEEALSKVASELANPNVSYIVADVTKATDVQKYVEHTLKTFGKIDVFFNNAGIEGVVKPIAEYPEEAFDKLILVNIKGVWLGLKYVLPEMNDGGSIINTSSVAGLSGTANMSAYVTSKHAVIGLTRTIALEAAPRNIRVNSIHPSPVDNRMMRSLEDGFAPGAGESAKQAFEATIPLKRYATNEDIANGVLFLSSDDSKFITGMKLVIDGGMTMA
ncbi:SDR family NAD(P)-dependent oxidoreductase [Elizabethkingia anophelis]|uniref:SDR family NAD(P)-dependent oxidoreductase n=1 Tax=Elizabethkingia anophelis TaxID=1117645 RepID=UPI0012B4065F|nr:SDR family oxidoreductase [Elizabethkingia anophelis]QGN24275.1 glucose 1-dehydrogenase [Elizabethkingia anophelis]QNV10916.1 SDR family oxidoreductase [Elizabethkingia anophelis]UTF89069.1 SDR family oxidoreductase [Elizabethkingia anophelis]UTF99991.1 SDR family oxidoreductase [Elizabethkingia anophelis]UTG03706.1 SDR family oxidoreductase [Elizabethkingia anophelis]